LIGWLVTLLGALV